MSYRDFEMPALPQTASEVQPVEARALGWSEIDGGVSINAREVGWRLNALLKIVQRQEEEIEQLKRRPGCPCSPGE